MREFLCFLIYVNGFLVLVLNFCVSGFSFFGAFVKVGNFCHV